MAGRLASKLRQGFIGEVLSSNLGKAGFIILLFMVVAAVYGYITLPKDFDVQWLDTTGVKGSQWHLYPKKAQPSWVSLLGIDVAPTVFYENLKPSEERAIVRPADFDALLPEIRSGTLLGSIRPLYGYAQVYTVSYELAAPVTPQDVAFAIKPSQTHENLTLISVKVLAFLIRPDNVVVKILDKTGHTQSELIEKIDCYSFAYDYVRHYNLSVSVADLCLLNPAFLAPSSEPGRYDVVTGKYRVKLVVFYLGDPALVENLVKEGVVGFDVDIRFLGTAFGIMGTDAYGRDLYQGLLYGFHIALLIGFFAATATVVVGTILGLVSGYFGGVIDEIVQRLADIIGNIPILPILILVGVALQTAGYSGYIILFAIIAFLVAFGWGGTAIMVRSMTLSIKGEPYIEAARAVGASSFRIIVRHILPQVLPYIVAVLVFSVPSAIIAEAGLSILGVRHDLPTWGSILSDALRNRDVAFKMWWWVLSPGMLLGMFSFAFVALGYAIESIVDPRLRR